MLCGVGSNQTREYRLVVDGSTTATGAAVGTWSGQLISYYVDDYSGLMNTGIFMSSSSSGPGVVTSSYNLAIPALGISLTRTYAVTRATLSQYVTLEGVKPIMDSSGVWFTKVAAVKWYVEGVLEHTDSTGWTIFATVFPMSASIPIFGIHPIITPGATVGPVTPIGCGAVGTARSTTCTVTGGWRYDEGYGWETLPVVIDYGALLGTGPSVGTVTATNTWDCTATAYYMNNGDHERRSSWVMAMPNLDRSVVKIAKGEFGMLVNRDGFPSFPVTRTLQETVLACDLEEISNTVTTDELTRYPAYGKLLDYVDGSGSSIEDPLSVTMYAPCGVGGEYIDCQATQIVTTSRANDYGSYGSTADVCTALVHPDWRALICNTWGAPMWSYRPYFPADATDANAQGWQADGTGADPVDYWLPNRQQILNHTDLPVGRKFPGRRTHLITDLLDQNGIKNVWQAMYGGRTYSGWGLCRFHTNEFRDYADMSVTLDNALMWIFPGGSGTGGSTVTLDPGTTVAEVQIGNWLVAPYQVGEACQEVNVSAPTNVDSWALYAVGYDDAKVLVATSAGSHNIPYSKGKKGFSTTVQDFGGVHMVDIGVDFDPARMESANILADSERVGCIGLLPTRTATHLRLEVVPTNPANPVTWAAPSLHRAAISQLKVWPERGAAWTIIQHHSGPGVRWGDQSYWDYVFNAPANPPIIRGVSYASTCYDWLNLRRTRLENLGFESGLQAEAETYWEYGLEWTQLAHLARDPEEHLTTLSCIVEAPSSPVAIFTNTYREFPPLSTFPHYDRDDHYALDTGSSPCMKVWCASEQRMYSIMPREDTDTNDLRLWTASGTTDLFDGDSGTTGWSIMWHKDDTLNDANTYRLGVLTKNIHRFRRWRGGMYVMWQALARAKALAILRLSFPVFMQARENSSGDLEVAREDWESPLSSPMPTLSTPVTGEELYGCWLETVRNGNQTALYVGYDGNVYYALSSDDGATWETMAEILTNAIYPRGAQNVNPRLIMAMRPDADDEPGVLIGKTQELGDASWSAEFTCTDQTGADIRVENQPFDVTQDGSNLILSAVKEGASGVTNWRSDDGGRTWNEI